MRRRNFIAGLLAAPFGVFASKFSPKTEDYGLAREAVNRRIDELALKLHRPIVLNPISGMAEIGSVNQSAFDEVEALR